MARKGQYEEWTTDDGIMQIEGWARDGLTNKQIAQNIGVSERAFTRWVKDFESISSALKRGKAPVDIQVENALLKRALGYEYEEKTTEIEEIPYIGKDGKEHIKTKKHIKKTVKQVAPDVTAQIYWLKNRRPDKWRDRQEQIITTVEDLTPLAEMLNE